MRPLILISIAMATLAASTTEPTQPYPFWDGQETIAEYAKKTGLEPTKTLDLGNGVKLELVLIPAGKFIMGTPEPPPVDELHFQTQIRIGKIAVAISVGVLLVMLTFVFFRAVREKHRPQVSLARLSVLALFAGSGLLGGLHWFYEARALSETQRNYDAALARFKVAGPIDEPAHEVTLTRAFYLSRHEVTQEQYTHVTNSNPSVRKASNRPVEMVSWNDAQEFCKKVMRMNTSDRGGSVTQIVRLPTEAEWEHACRAGTRTSFYTGDTKADLDRAGWYYKNIDCGAQPVGRKVPNTWSLYDMHGNVSEWCADWYGDYSVEAVTDPQGPSHGEFRVLRGGCWGDDLDQCLSASRFPAEATFRNVGIGFRVVLELTH